MSNSLLVSDLHLTEAPRDAYRWGLFPWVKEQCWKHQVGDVLILGDLTDAKDHHSSRLVNGIADALVDLTKSVRVHVLRGNHDGIDAECPYFRFLQHLPNILFYWHPTTTSLVRRKVLMLPHSRRPEEDWKTLDFSSFARIFAHVTVGGAQAEQGIKLSGCSADLFKDTPVWSGDVHVPQKIAKVHYVGAPYPVRFGDRFQPRCVLLDSDLNHKADLHYHTLHRRMVEIKRVEDLASYVVRKGDQIKVRLALERGEYGKWPEHRAQIVSWAQTKGLDLVSVELVRATTTETLRTDKPGRSRELPLDQLRQYCTRSRLDQDLQDIGESLLK